MSRIIRTRCLAIVIITLFSGFENGPSSESILAAAATNDQGGESSNHESIKLGCVGSEVLLSGNRTLAPLELVEASYSLERTPPSKVYDSVTTWCTSDNDHDRYIDMQFTSPLLISMMITMGSRLIVNSLLGVYYVTNFTLEYSSPENETTLNYYTTTSESVNPENVKYFEVSGFTTLIQFERPFLTRRIRLRQINWFDSDGERFSVQYVCQGVSLYGCLASEAIEQGTTDTVIRETKPLAIVLPITLIIITVLLVLLAVLVTCLFMKRGAYVKKKRADALDSGYSHLDRSQQLTVSTRPEEMSMNEHHEEANTEARCANFESRKSSAIKKVENPIYGTERPTYMGGRVSIYPPISESMNYEPIDPNKEQSSNNKGLENGSGRERSRHDITPEVNEEGMASETIELDELNTVSKTVQLKRDSMIDNTAYAPEKYVPAAGVNHETGEHRPYEEVVALQNNASYEYVKMATQPSLIRDN